MLTDVVTAQNIASYLNGLPDTTAAPVVVRIGRTEYIGALYTQRRTISEGCRAYDEGRRDYYQRGLYLIGSLPASYVRSSHTAYVWATDVRSVDARWYSPLRWYVAGWYDHDEPNDYHPFGRMFQLFPDDADVTRDDEGNPYDTRIMTSVTW